MKLTQTELHVEEGKTTKYQHSEVGDQEGPCNNDTVKLSLSMLVLLEVGGAVSFDLSCLQCIWDTLSEHQPGQCQLPPWNWS